MQLGIGVVTTGIDAGQIDGQAGVGRLGVGGIEIKVAGELAESAIDPRPRLVVGETDGAGIEIHVRVFNGTSLSRNTQRKHGKQG
ncbi:hypothetical protein D3C72_2351000 [compost metagenome]